MKYRALADDWPGVTYIENHCMSTQALIFALIHWQATLDKDVKASVRYVFNALLDKHLEAIIL